MKATVRVIAITFVVAAAIAGNSLPKNSTVAVAHHALVPGPIPTCNPLTQSCGNVRDK